MMVLVTYDVSVTDEGGQTRLSKVAKICQNHGQRVQNSVFECIIDPAQYVQLKGLLSKAIDKEKDSIRFYRLGKNWNNKIEHIGAKEVINIEDDTIIL